MSKSSKEFLSPKTLMAPAGYSHAAKVHSGTIVYLAGQVSSDASGKLIGEGNFEAQVEQVFRNLKTAVEAAGGAMADVVKVTIYVTNIKNNTKVWAARREFFTGDFPASTLVEVSALAAPEILVEIEAIAHIGKGQR